MSAMDPLMNRRTDDIWLVDAQKPQTANRKGELQEQLL
jgi:hypothetical protein